MRFRDLFASKAPPRMPREAILWNKYVSNLSLTWHDTPGLSPLQRNVAIAFRYGAEIYPNGHANYFELYPEISPDELINALIEVGASAFVENFRNALLYGEEDDYANVDETFESLERDFMDILREYVVTNAEELGIAIGYIK